ncbi:hypothetical protein J5295_05690 [Riemerella anatipestifer]|uniref:Uncharacterized protein n=1 Tax=Riemerella anatipestifer (strain ATCC 11845 / DSM 15868 / JCM 9532 / NCTC 11014) TaxID=693978 RepID=E4TB51_RIEAD|nr:hypothetical protein [Riemerella anatipestifer]ADQ81287.1 hypothetical protein Riean_0112 [Riemerella anatipestifer ATCC 11845 = DSM 15868]ADZ11230.1 hypothetical protein RIA_0027 [Riemerella anatipestifer RA-GD]AFD55309.1 hypothetical protein RA0C_0319 [Riemerella anatipestifer ATCC 11845 = DSM 15868]AGC40820.1 hypothetical protein G148_1516 [Riemerella anatipestifer RA-CH-2]AKP68593.1 hypothetical protein CG08_0121 [Riemerella anatipestifer]
MSSNIRVNRLCKHCGKTFIASSSSKGSAYEKLVAEIFKQLDFEVEILDQGNGRNSDA